MASILIIDDEKLIQVSLSERIQQLGHEVFTASTLKQGTALMDRENISLVFLDIHLPDGNGLDILPDIRRNPSRPEVIIITALGSRSGAETAIRNGAWDYVTKPFDKNEIRLLLERALDYQQLNRQKAGPFAIDPCGIIGQSSGIRECMDRIATCAGSDANVLIQGETGTGKELVAAAIHANHTTIVGDYVIVDCSAMPETLVESVLFGHVKGAFTGADKLSEGLVKQADGGTLFLDEVGELPLSLQKAFLRVLQEKRFRPVGSSKEEQSRFRLISATNRDLEAMVQQGRFREDLLYRLKTVSIQLPPLRKRKEDIELLAHHFIQRFCRKISRKTKALLPETLDMLEGYPWPGNVRELASAIEKAVVSNPESPILYPMFFPKELRIHHARQKVGEKEGDGQPVIDISSTVNAMLSSFYEAEPAPTLQSLRTDVLSRLESGYLQHILSGTGWDMEKSIAVSGLKKSQFYALMKKYDLKK